MNMSSFWRAAGRCCPWLTLVLCLNVTRLQAQLPRLLKDYTIRQWGIEQGLPESVVTALHQSEDGYLWCIGLHKAARFDGLQFSTIAPKPLPPNFPQPLLGMLDRGREGLWFYGGHGAARFDGQHWQVCPTPGSVWKMFFGSTGRLWAATEQGFCEVRGTNFTQVPFPLTNTVTRYYSAAFQADGSCWMACGGGVLRFRDGDFQYVKIPPDLAGAIYTYTISVSAAGTVWIASGDRLFCRRDDRWSEVARLPEISRSQPVISAILEGAEGDLWVGTEVGVFRWSHGQWSTLTARDGVCPPEVRCLAEDRDGQIWIGTAGGLVRLHPKTVRFFEVGASPEATWVTAVAPNQGTNLLVGLTGGGLWEKSDDSFRHLDQEFQPLKASTVSALLHAGDGSWWIGTQGEHLWHFYEGKATKISEAPGVGISSRNITALFEDHQGTLWAGTWDGLMVQDEEEENRLRAVLPYLNPVCALMGDGKGGVWVGHQGIGLVNVNGKKFSRPAGLNEGLINKDVRALLRDADNVIWLGTLAGLVRWDGDQVTTFATAQGLPDQDIRQILEDSLGYLWLGTAHGLVRVSKADCAKVVRQQATRLEVQVFGRNEGMNTEECTGGFGSLAARTEDGRLWFATHGGLAMVEPDRLPPTRQSTLPVYVEEICANGHTLWTRPLLNTANAEANRELVIPPGSGGLEFHFTSPSFAQPESVQFRYRILGYVDEWSAPTPNRSLTGVWPRPGRYVFEVEARLRNGEWGTAARSVPLVVQPFFWQTAWFSGLLVLAGSIVVFLVGRQAARRRYKRRMERLELLRAVERERARIAQDLHDDLGTDLSRLAMLSDLAQVDADRPANVRRHLDEIFQSADDMVHKVDEIVWAVNPANDALENFNSYLVETAQQVFNAAGVRLRLDVAVPPLAVKLNSTLRHHVFLVLKEAMNNVVKHAGAAEVHLTVRLEGTRLRLELADNGRGFVLSQIPGSESGHDGLQNMRARVAEVGGTLVIDSAPSQGTMVRVEVPLK